MDRLLSTCNRCGHVWLPHEKTKHTKCCPHCHSPYWDKERKRIKNIKEVIS